MLTQGEIRKKHRDFSLPLALCAPVKTSNGCTWLDDRSMGNETTEKYRR
jgi:hypothetical protein